MKRALATIAALALFTLIGSPVSGHDWSSVAKKVMAASFPLTTASGDIFCTGFMINAERDYALTAAHCVPERRTELGALADGQPVVIEWAEEELDVAVLRVPNKRPALKPYFGVLAAGQEMASYGFAREAGLYSHFRIGNLAAVYAEVNPLPGLWIVTDQPFIGGMSGGPVVDTHSRVIAQVQRSDRALTGIGKSVGEIWRSTRKYWGS